MQARCFISRPDTCFFSQHTREPINIRYLPGRAELFGGNPLTAHIQRNLSAIPQNVSASLVRRFIVTAFPAKR